MSGSSDGVHKTHFQSFGHDFKPVETGDYRWVRVRPHIHKLVKLLPEHHWERDEEHEWAMVRNAQGAGQMAGGTA